LPTPDRKSLSAYWNVNDVPTSTPVGTANRDTVGAGTGPLKETGTLTTTTSTLVTVTAHADVSVITTVAVEAGHATTTLPPLLNTAVFVTLLVVAADAPCSSRTATLKVREGSGGMNVAGELPPSDATPCAPYTAAGYTRAPLASSTDGHSNDRSDAALSMSRDADAFSCKPLPSGLQVTNNDGVGGVLNVARTMASDDAPSTSVTTSRRRYTADTSDVSDSDADSVRGMTGEPTTLVQTYDAMPPTPVGELGS
jgi:hypothetical protein